MCFYSQKFGKNYDYRLPLHSIPGLSVAHLQSLPFPGHFFFFLSRVSSLLFHLPQPPHPEIPFMAWLTFRKASKRGLES